jgi:hypothetical protein
MMGHHVMYVHQGSLSKLIRRQHAVWHPHIVLRMDRSSIGISFLPTRPGGQERRGSCCWHLKHHPTLVPGLSRETNLGIMLMPGLPRFSPFLLLKLQSSSVPSLELPDTFFVRLVILGMAILVLLLLSTFLVPI